MFLTAACCQKNCSSWDIWCSSPACPQYYSAKVSNIICNPFRDIKFEIIRTGEDWRGIFIVQSVPLIPCDCTERTISISISIDCEEKMIEGIVFEGGQQVLLSPDDSITLIEALLNQQEVTVKMGRYCSTLPLEGFYDAYTAFCK
jgi:hypothetical protein